MCQMENFSALVNELGSMECLGMACHVRGVQCVPNGEFVSFGG